MADSTLVWLIFFAVAAIAQAAFLIYRKARNGTTDYVPDGSVERLKSSFEIVAKGNLDYRIRYDEKDSTAPAYQAFNNMITRLEDVRQSAETRVDKQRRLMSATQQSAVSLSDTIIQLKSAQKQLIRSERLRALEQVISGMTHDLNNALTPIMSTADFLLTYPKQLSNKAHVTELLETILESAQAMRKQVSNLSELVSPSEMSDAKQLNLNDVIERSIELTRPKWKAIAEAEGIAIKCEKEFGKVRLIKGIEGELTKAFTALIINSIEAMPDGGTMFFRTSMDKQCVVVVVRDTGIGMSEEVLQRAQEPFFTTKGSGSSGLGLSLAVAKFVRCKANLHINGKEGEGTTITLRFPVETTAQWPKLDRKQDKPHIPKKLRILVIDDEPMVREAMATLLSGDDHSVTMACCGEDGLAESVRSEYDVIFVDKAMPDKDGERVAAEMKKIDKNRPVILVTGFRGMPGTNKGIRNGVDFVLSKPCTVSEIRHAISTVMHWTKSSSSPRKKKATKVAKTAKAKKAKG